MTTTATVLQPLVWVGTAG